MSGDTGTDSSLTWSAPVLIAQNGEDGNDGQDGLGADPILNSTNDAFTGLTHVSVGNGITIDWNVARSRFGFTGSILGAPTGNPTIELRRNGTIIDSLTVAAFTTDEPGFWSWNFSLGGTRTVLDTPGVGSHSYNVTISGDGTGGTDTTLISTREEQ